MMATVPHVTSGSELRKFQADEFLSNRVYILRHDTVCAELHCNICKETGGKLDNTCYDHVPKLVETSHEGKVTILWNQWNYC